MTNTDDRALIAAAPQLLDAARDAAYVLTMQTLLFSGPNDPEALALAKLTAAIAAAEGTQ